MADLPRLFWGKKKNCRRKKSQQGNRYKSALPPPFSSRSGSATGKEGEMVGFVVPICRCPAYNSLQLIAYKVILVTVFFFFNLILFLSVSVTGRMKEFMTTRKTPPHTRVLKDSLITKAR